MLRFGVIIQIPKVTSSGFGFLSVLSSKIKFSLQQIIEKFPDPEFPYILAVQPETLQAIDICSTFVNSAGGSDMRLKICNKEEIFHMKEELMTVGHLERVFFSTE